MKYLRKLQSQTAWEMDAFFFVQGLKFRKHSKIILQMIRLSPLIIIWYIFKRLTIQNLNFFLWSWRCGINIKINLYTAIVQPIVTYASARWQMTKHIETLVKDLLFEILPDVPFKTCEKWCYNWGSVTGSINGIVYKVG